MLFARPNRRKNVIPIRPDNRMFDAHRQISDLAYEFWLDRCFRRNGSPEESYLRAVLEVTFRQGIPVVNSVPESVACLAPMPAHRSPDTPPEAA